VTSGTKLGYVVFVCTVRAPLSLGVSGRICTVSRMMGRGDFQLAAGNLFRRWAACGPPPLTSPRSGDRPHVSLRSPRAAGFPGGPSWEAPCLRWGFLVAGSPSTETDRPVAPNSSVDIIRKRLLLVGATVSPPFWPRSSSYRYQPSAPGLIYR